MNSSNAPKSASPAESGRILSTMHDTDLNCYINRDDPNSNRQPSIYIPNHYLSSASMVFSNIVAHNYTKDIEPEISQYITNPYTDRPLYVYQQFAIEVSQYVNNITIGIQDDPDTKTPEYTEDNSWEVAIMNCTDDESGTPNNETLAILQKQHPPDDGFYWYTFDFENSEIGPVYLDTSTTYSTIESGVTKYWFAYRVKIPADDTALDGGIKKLYFNPDGGDPSNMGEGETFLFYPSINYENFTYNYVSKINDSTPINGTYLTGGISSFEEKDENRYAVDFIRNNLTMEFFFNIQNHSQYSYDEMSMRGWPWWSLNKPIKSIDFELSLKVSNPSNVQGASLYVWNYTGNYRVRLPDFFFNLSNNNERIQVLRLAYNPFEPTALRDIIRLINTSDNNAMKFMFEYNGNGEFNVSINKFSINFGEKREVLNDVILSYDPLLRELYSPVEINLVNGTTSTPQLQTLELNDDKYYKARAKTTNVSIEIKFEFMPEIDPYLWTWLDPFDWGVLGPIWQTYPFPYVKYIDFRLSSNVSITDFNELKLAALEVYDRFNDSWTDITGYNKTFAFNDERQLAVRLNTTDTYFILQISDPDDKNSFWMRLRYETNESYMPNLEKFNVTVDEFIMDFHIQNIFSSDISSKIGFGMKSNKLNASDIQMKNMGIPLTDDGVGNGTWNNAILNGIPVQGNFEFNVTSLWPSVTFDVIGTYEIYQLAIDIDFKDDLEIQYMTGTEYFTVEITDGMDSPISGLEITFELLDADDKVVDDDTDNTDSDGEATGALELDELGDGFYIKVSYNLVGIYGSKETESDEFRIVDEFTIFMDNFLLLLPYILIGLAALFTFVAIRHRKLSKLRELWAGEALVLDDLVKISYIMVIHKDVGVTLYSKQISMELDSDLIGGFITAISQFRSEIKKPIEGLGMGTGFEMDYYDFKIDMADGKYVRTALILEGIPSEKLKENQKMFTNNFETKFAPLLEDFTGDVQPFRETDALIEKFFNLSLMYPLQLSSHWKLAKLKKLETALLEVAEQMQKERKYFFVSSLLNYGIAGRKESKDQIISTIIDLKRRGLLVPVENI
ncbi:MAG: hypothetical protein ACFE8A_11485 [Candidatus Hodarchaeota archaeon]